MAYETEKTLYWFWWIVFHVNGASFRSVIGFNSSKLFVLFKWDLMCTRSCRWQFNEMFCKIRKIFEQKFSSSTIKEYQTKPEKVSYKTFLHFRFHRGIIRNHFNFKSQRRIIGDPKEFYTKPFPVRFSKKNQTKPEQVSNGTFYTCTFT